MHFDRKLAKETLDNTNSLMRSAIVAEVIIRIRDRQAQINHMEKKYGERPIADIIGSRYFDELLICGELIIQTQLTTALQNS